MPNPARTEKLPHNGTGRLRGTDAGPDQPPPATAVRPQAVNPDRGEDDNQEYPDCQRVLRLAFNDPKDFAGEYDPMQVSAHTDAVSLFDQRLQDFSVWL